MEFGNGDYDGAWETFTTVLLKGSGMALEA